MKKLARFMAKIVAKEQKKKDIEEAKKRKEEVKPKEEIKEEAKQPLPAEEEEKKEPLDESHELRLPPEVEILVQERSEDLGLSEEDPQLLRALRESMRQQ